MRNKGKKCGKRILSAGLAAAVCATGFQLSPLLDGRTVKAQEAEYQKQLEETKVEVEEERTEDTTSYELADGTRQLVIHSSEVRYEDANGELVDYDPTLTEIKEKQTMQERSLEGYAFENTEGDRKQYLPEKLDPDTPLLLEHDDLAIQMQPVTDREDNVFGTIEAYKPVQSVKEMYTDIYEEEQEAVLCTFYEAKDESLELAYTSNTDGVKETIVLNEKPEGNVFSYRLDLDGLEPVLNEETKEVELYRKGESEEPAAVIEAPYMNDATQEAYSEDIFYDIQPQDDGTWLLIMTVDQEYLDTAQYPVVIDPTATWSGSTMIDDVYIADGDHKNHNFYAAASQAFFAGQNHSGLKLRSLIKLHDLKTTLNGKCVTSAVLNLYEAGGDAGVTVNSYALTSTRANSSATWANQPTINGTVLGTCKTTGEIGNKVVMNMTKFVQELCNGTRSYNYGIMMKSTSETNKKYGKFYGVRFTNAGKRPTLVIQYTDGPTTATSVSASPVYVRRGGTTKVTWAGINSSQLSYIQYRVQKSGQTDNLVNYSANTKIGTTSSGSANIKLGDWTDGTYYIYVRGVDKGGIKGVAKGVKVIVDSTAPAFEKASITPVTTETSYGAVYPTASWKVTEPNFRDLYYSMDQGATWKKLSTAKEGSAAIPASEFTKEGAYRIYLRAFDKAGNYKTSAGMNYYFDSQKPDGLHATLNDSGSVVTGNIKTPKLSWSDVVETHLAYVQYCVNDGTYVTAGSALQGSVQLPQSYFP